MPLRLRANLHWCDSGGRAVFLDVEADRYFCLPAAANQAFLRLAKRQGRLGDPECLRILLSRGILVEDDASAGIEPPPVIDPPARDVADEINRPSDLFSILRQLVSEMLAVRLLRTRPFFEVIEAVARKAASCRRIAREPDKEIQAIANASSALSYAMRMHDRCLPRALAVHSTCTRRGIRPKLVFGVTAHPFAAHCWVQYGNAVVVGGFEQARLYTPILVLE